VTLIVTSLLTKEETTLDRPPYMDGNTNDDAFNQSPLVKCARTAAFVVVVVLLLEPTHTHFSTDHTLHIERQSRTLDNSQQHS